MGEEVKEGSRLPMKTQDIAIAELHETISVLTDKLGPILTPQPPESEKEKVDHASPLQSPLADHLDNSNIAIRRATVRLQTLINTAEC